MSAFLTELEVVCVDDTANSGRGIWRVEKDFVYQSDLLGRAITIEAGFLTDFASVPRVPFAYWLFGDSAHKAAVIHDWLFHHHEICDEHTANRVLLEAMDVEHIPEWRRIAIYEGVQIGGESSWEADAAGNGHTIVDGRIA
jgi:hypothetical protein